MPQRFDTAARGAVMIGGRDLTRHAKRFSSTENIGAVDDTHMQPDGDAMNFIAGLETAAISISGSLPVSKALVELEMRKALGLARDAEPLLLAPWGTVPTYYAEFLQTEQTRFGSDGLTPNITSYNADFVGTGGLKRGTVLHNSQGTGTATQDEIKSLTFVNVDPGQGLALRAATGAETFPFTTATTNAEYKAGLEALPAFTGRIVTVTGSALSGSGLKSGTKTFTFDGGVNVAELEVISGQVERFVVTNGDSNPYTLNGAANFTLGISAADLQSGQRALGGQRAAVVVVKNAVAATGYMVAGAGEAIQAIPNSQGVSPNGTYVSGDVTLESAGFRLGANADNYYFLLDGDAISNQDFAGKWYIAFRTGSTTYLIYSVAKNGATIPSDGWVSVNGTNPPTSVISTSADFTLFYPLTATPADPTSTGTGDTVTKTIAAGGAATTVTSPTTQPGGTVTANIVNAAFNGTWIDLLALTQEATTNDGGAAIIETTYAAPGTGATVRIQHADDNGSGAPGSATTLAVFDVVTQIGAQLVTIPRGTQCKRWVRAAISSGQITGSLAFTAAICRNSTI